MNFNENFNFLENDKIKLLIIEKNMGDENVIPYYYYAIMLKEIDTEIGKISIRIGHNKHSYYNGNIGFEIYEEYRGFKYSLLASKLVLQIAEFHEMNYLYLSCDESNNASSKIIENLGANFIEVVVPPIDYIFYYEGMERQKIYKLDL
ncbi:MAG: GNAT family N-acetyltransferase [Acholeplasmataceae bacterium]|nr:GNAT family N-acetyltransferase [Acholeplasmataceae bacterium]